MEDVTKTDLKLSDVVTFAKEHWTDSTPSNLVSKTFADFDFNRLKPIENSDNKDYKITVFYNEQKEIMKIYKSDRLPDSDFEFKFIFNRDLNYVIFFAKQFFSDEMQNEQNGPVLGFFVLYNDHCYFISLGARPFCIMNLDSNLKVISTLRFCSGELRYKTKIKYINSGHLYSDILYSAKNKMTIDKQTTLTDVLSQFDVNANFVYEREMKLGWVEDQDHLPLWIMGGLHEYDVQVAPVPNTLPRETISFNCFPVPPKE
jgi:hypothetical protein